MVLLAYACAAATSPLLLIGHGLLQEGPSSGFSPGTTGMIISYFAAIAAIYALPVALPVIIATEYYRRGDWWIFLSAGVALGLLMTALFTPVPYNRADFITAASLTPIVIVCVMIYWSVAWKWLAPQRRSETV